MLDPTLPVPQHCSHKKMLNKFNTRLLKICENLTDMVIHFYTYTGTVLTISFLSATKLSLTISFLQVQIQKMRIYKNFGWSAPLSLWNILEVGFKHRELIHFNFDMMLNKAVESQRQHVKQHSFQTYRRYHRLVQRTAHLWMVFYFGTIFGLSVPVGAQRASQSFRSLRTYGRWYYLKSKAWWPV